MYINKKKIFVLIVTTLLMGITTVLGTYAFLSWNSNEITSFNVVTDPTLEKYIIYDEGESQFIGDFKLSNTYTEGVHTTVSVSKTNDATNIPLIATLKMTVNEIGPNMSKYPGIKWVVTSGDETSRTILSQGNFLGVTAGDDDDALTLYSNIEVTTSVKKFTVWLWADITENPNSAMIQEKLDTSVWMEVIQSMEGQTCNVTQISANYQNINATGVCPTTNITKYAVTTSNTEPSSWTNITSAEQNKIYNLNNYMAGNTGTYYVWFKDNNNYAFSKNVQVSELDQTGPTCTWGTFSKQAISDNETTQIELTCTDNGVGLPSQNITASNITLSNTELGISINLTKTETIQNGYKYTFTVTGGEGTGETTLSLTANKIKDRANNGNAIATSNTLSNYNEFDITYKDCGGTSFTGTHGQNYPQTYMYGTGATLDNPTKTGYTFGGYYETSACSGTVKTTISSTETGDKTFYAKWTTNSAAITLKKDGSNYTGLTLALYQSGTSKYTSPSTSNGVYTFNTVANGTYDIYIGGNDSGEDITVNGSGTKTINFYTVSLTKGTGISAVSSSLNSTGFSPASGVYKNGSSVKLSATVSTGYTFSKWTQTNGGAQVSTTNAYTGTISSTWSYTANATVNSYTITYKDCGDTTFSGTHESGYPQNYTYGVGATLDSPTKTSYAFSGYYETSACSGTAVTNVSSTATGDKTYYAKWLEKNYQVGSNYYATLATAIADTSCNTSCTITVLKNVTDSSSVTIAADKEIILDTSDKTLTKTSSSITNNGTLTVTGSGTIETSLTYGIYNTGSLTIQDSVTIENTLADPPAYGVWSTGSSSSVTMTGGTIIGYTGIRNYSGATATISGGTIIGTSSEGIENASNANLTISGTTQISGSSYGISNNNSASLTMTGGTVTGDNGIYNSTNASTTVTGGTITGTTYGIYNKSTLTIGALSNAVNNTNPVIIGNSFGLFGSGTLNFYNGISKGKYSGIYNGGGTVNYREGYTIATGTDTINSEIYNTAYLVPATYSLTITQGTGSTITVNRTSSPLGGGTTGNLSNGATLYLNDTLTITFGANAGYTLGTHTVNGTTFTSGNTHTVTGNTTVVSSATANTSTVTLDSNGGTIPTTTGWTITNGGANATNQVTYNSTYGTLPTPTRTGYTFSGWTDQKTVFGSSTFDGSTFYSLGRKYMYTDKISIHIEASMTDWANYTRMISCTQSGGWNIEPSSTYISYPVYVTDSGYIIATSTVTFSSLSSGWHSFDLIFDGTSVKGYLDGTLIASSATFASSTIGYYSGNAIFIGAEAGGNINTPAGPYFNGSIRNVIINNNATKVNNVNTITSSTVVNNNSNHTLYASWVPNNYTIGYTLNGETGGTNNPTSGTYDADVQISNPSKTFTVNITDNNNTTLSSTSASKTQTFSGWTSTTVGSNAKTGTGANPSTAWSGSSTKNKYFKNLRESGTVTMIANWTPVAITLPTVTKTGYTCGFSTTSGGTTINYASGANYTPSATTNNVTLYTVCEANSYTITVEAGNGLSAVALSGWTNTGTATMSKTLTYGSTLDLSTITKTYKNGYSGSGYVKTSGSGSISGSTLTVGAGATTITINATTIETPVPTVAIASTSKIYGASATALSASISNTYDSGITVSYTYYYDTSSTGTYGNTQTESISATSHKGTRYYKVKATASDGTITSSTGTSSNNVSLALTRAKYTPNANSCGTLSSTSALYAYKEETSLYTSSTGSTSGTWPTITANTGYTVSGWYSAASGGTKVLNADGSLTGTAVSGYTSATAYVSTTNRTLYAQCTINSYTLTINPNGGSYNGTTLNTTVSQNYNTNYEVQNNATRTGYVFNGWMLTSGNGELTWYDADDLLTSYVINSSSATKPSVYNNESNGTVTHTIISDSTSSTGYSLKIVTNGVAWPGAGGFVNSTTAVSGVWFYHEFVAKVPTGYTISPAANSRGIGSIHYWLTPNAGTGNWETYIYITPCGDNGAFSSFGYVYVSGTDNTSVTWYLRESKMYKISTNRSSTESTSMNFKFVASNATLTAQWGTSGSRVTWNANSGTFASGTTTYADMIYQTAYTATKVAPYYISDSDYKLSRTGYTFAGWNTKADGTGTKIFNADGSLVASVSGYSDANKKWLKYDANVTLYAKWTANTYTIKYYQGNNSGTSGNTQLSGTTSCTYGSSCTLKTYGGTAPSGWTFAGWNTSPSGTSVTYSNGASVSNLTSTNGGTVNLYAVFKKTITIKSGVSGATSTTTTQYYNPQITSQVTSISVAAPTAISNWTALGYRDDTTAGAKEYGSASAGSVTLPYNSGATLYAVYSRTLTISYNGNGSTSGTTASTTATIYLNTNSTTTSSQAVTLANNGFAKTGNTFSKWAAGSTSGTQYAAGASYTAGLAYNASTFGTTMYAIWTFNLPSGAITIAPTSGNTKYYLPIVNTSGQTIKATITITSAKEGAASCNNYALRKITFTDTIANGVTRVYAAYFYYYSGSYLSVAMLGNINFPSGSSTGTATHMAEVVGSKFDFWGNNQCQYSGVAHQVSALDGSSYTVSIPAKSSLTTGSAWTAATGTSYTFDRQVTSGSYIYDAVNPNGRPDYRVLGGITATASTELATSSPRTQGKISITFSYS